MSRPVPLALLLYTLFAILAPAASAGEGTAIHWLQRMGEAVHTLDYRGTFVFQQGERMESVEIVHRVANGEERERISALGGEAREVVREDGKITCVLPGRVMETPGLPRALVDGGSRAVEALSDHYRLALDGGERVSGMPARRVKIEPRDRFRYGYRLWLDEQSALPLKSQLFGGDGELLEQMMFTSLERSVPIEPKALEPTVEGPGVQLRRREESGAVPRWRVERLPAGFALVMAGRHSLPGRGREVEHLLFSDGLASVSVFIEPEGEEDEGEGRDGARRMGPVHAFGTSRDGHRVTVIGEVPAETVGMIADSLVREGAEEGAE